MPPHEFPFPARLRFERLKFERLKFERLKFERLKLGLHGLLSDQRNNNDPRPMMLDSLVKRFSHTEGEPQARS